MDNLDDYILSFQNYKDGNYEYETITSLVDIEKAIESGKKFVFLETSAKIYIIIGFILIFVGLIIALILYIVFYHIFLTFDPFIVIILILIPFLIFDIIGLRMLISGFWKLRTTFIVLGAEGIVYKLKRGGVKGFNWEEISIDFYRTGVEITWEGTKELIDSIYASNITSIDSFLIYISMPNGDLIDFGQGDYTMREFPDKKQIGHGKANALFLLTFLNYYNYGKKWTFEPSNL
jgi:hypothetical protein